MIIFSANLQLSQVNISIFTSLLVAIDHVLGEAELTALVKHRGVSTATGAECLERAIGIDRDTDLRRIKAGVPVSSPKFPWFGRADTHETDDNTLRFRQFAPHFYISVIQFTIVSL